MLSSFLLLINFFSLSPIVQEQNEESSSETCGDGDESSLYQRFQVFPTMTTRLLNSAFTKPSNTAVSLNQSPAIASFVLYLHCVVEVRKKEKIRKEKPKKN